MDSLGKWLVLTRAAVRPMTIWSGLIGVLLAVGVANTVGGVSVDYRGTTIADASAWSWHTPRTTS